MNNFNKYLTVQNFNETSLKEKSSIFIAQVYPVENETAAIETLGQIKKKYYDASHHCYAYILLDQKVKYSDDGEPNGTAGIRILNAINHFNLKNILVIVIRYFGGTKLGIGPLGKAYYNSAVQSLESSLFIEKIGYKRILIEADLNLINSIYHLIDQFKGRINKSDFTSDIKFDCFLPYENSAQFISSLNEISKGKVIINEAEKILYI